MVLAKESLGCRYAGGCRVVIRRNWGWGWPPSQSPLGKARHHRQIVGRAGAWTDRPRWIGLGLGRRRRHRGRPWLPLVIATSLSQSLTAGAGGCVVVSGTSWWQLSSPSDDAWVVVDVIDAEGCPGFVSGGVCVVVVCTYLMASMTSACHGRVTVGIIECKSVLKLRFRAIPCNAYALKDGV